MRGCIGHSAAERGAVAARHVVSDGMSDRIVRVGRMRDRIQSERKHEDREHGSHPIAWSSCNFEHAHKKKGTRTAGEATKSSAAV